MAKKRREDRSSTSGGGFESPFARLGALRGTLPEGPPDDDDGAPETTSSEPARGKIVVRKERAGRGGKTVTVVEGLALDDDALAALAGDLKRALACGASLEDGAIVLQGDLDERAALFLEQRGLGRVVLGSRRR